MGKTSKPLSFIIEKSIDGQTFDALRAQGHFITAIGEDDATMGYFGPKCWRMDKRVAEDPKLFEAALKSMREIYNHGVENPKAAKAKTGQPTAKSPAARKTRRTVAAAVIEGDSGITEVPGPAVDYQTSLLGGHEEGHTTGVA